MALSGRTCLNAGKDHLLSLGLYQYLTRLISRVRITRGRVSLNRTMACILVTVLLTDLWTGAIGPSATGSIGPLDTDSARLTVVILGSRARLYLKRCRPHIRTYLLPWIA